MISLTDKAAKYLEKKGIELEIYKTGQLKQREEEISEKDSSIIHLTC